MRVGNSESEAVMDDKEKPVNCGWCKYGSEWMEFDNKTCKTVWYCGELKREIAFLTPIPDDCPYYGKEE